MTGDEHSEGDELRRRMRRRVNVGELVAAMAADGGFAGLLARCEAWADRVLGPVLTNPHPERTPAWVLFEAARPKWEYPDREWFAERLRREVAALRAALDRGDALAAAMAAHSLGKLQQEVNDRLEWAPAARLGAKVVRGGRNGGKARAGEYVERNAQIAALYCSMPAAWTADRCYREIHENFRTAAGKKLSVRQIRRIIETAEER